MKSFWNGKRVFLTGHTGFKGSWLTLWLRRLGAEVVGYSLAPASASSMYVLANLDREIESTIADIRDADELKARMVAAKPDVVIHMAAQALVKAAYADPTTTYTTNVIGTLNVLEAVRLCPTVKVVVSITSDKCYENVEWVWGYRENDPMGGHDPYSSSKGCAELLIAAYRDSYFRQDTSGQIAPQLASVRAGNVIGGGDWSEDRLVPDVMRAIIADKPVLIRRPEALRPWQFVLEPLRGYLGLAERMWNDGSRFSSGWNFGPDVDQIKPVQWIVDYLTGSWAGDASWVLDQTQHPPEDTYLKLDCAKAKHYLDWRPILPLETVLDWIIEWYEAFASNQNLLTASEAQIIRYESMLEDN